MQSVPMVIMYVSLLCIVLRRTSNVTASVTSGESIVTLKCLETALAAVGGVRVVVVLARNAVAVV